MRAERPAGLLRFLAASLLVHGLVGLFWKAPPMPAEPPGKTRLSVDLHRARPAPVEPTMPPGAAVGRQATTKRVRPGTVLGTTLSPTPAEFPEAPAVAINRLEQAKTWLVEESRQRRRDPMFAPASPAVTVDSPLGRTTARPAAGEKILGDGLLQLTTADGKVHCLQKPPDIVGHDLPGGSLAIPVTCPF